MAERFNLKFVHDNFKQSIRDKHDVDLKLYLDSYSELNKFFTLMGTIFGFVSQDLTAKMDILITLLQGNEEKFKTARNMIIYEKENNLLKKKDYVSGSRTLLRLHRGLDFIRLFLRYISELKGDEYTGNVCKAAYAETLQKFHSSFIAMGAKVAMYTLPTKDELLKRVCGTNDEDLQEAVAILPETLDVIATVYNIIEDMYTEHDLHSLP